MVLKTQDLTKTFGKLAAVNRISFGVEEGEVFGIAGPNGAGKSTLFNMIAGYYRPSAGSIFFRGHDITGLGADRTCALGIGRTFQIPATFHTLSVYDNIRVGATFGRWHHARGTVRETIEEVAEFLSLSAKLSLSARNLDLYTTKLVMLAAALATDCRLLMLDEPMAGLSISEIEDFLHLVRRINQDRGITIVIIEHLLDILISITGRMMIINNGELLYLGDPTRVTEDRRVVDVYLGGRTDIKGVEDRAGA